MRRGTGEGGGRENCNDKRQVKVNVVWMWEHTQLLEGQQKGEKVNSDEMQIAADLCREMAANGPTKRKEGSQSKARE